MRWGLSLSVIFLLAALATPGVSAADVRVHKVGEFTQPVYVTGAPGDGERLYVVERRGTIQVVQDGVVKPFVDLSAYVRGPGDPGAGGEEGLLSMAFAPDFQTSRRFYVYFTAPDGRSNRVEELIAPTDDTANGASGRLVISIPHVEGSHHNGGQIQFGPDDMLYIAPGDGGTGGRPARDLSSLHGKLLRIDPHPLDSRGYSSPTGNPFLERPGRRDEIWAYGLRNPFRFSFDRQTGDLTIGDVGEKAVEEIDYLPFAEGRGYAADLGWNACEGSFAAGTRRPCGLVGSVLPALEHTRSEGFRAIVNGYVVRDPSLPSLYGRLVYGDFYVDALRSAVLGPGGASDIRAIGAQAQVPRLTSFGEDAGGCVYATSYEGGVYRLVENDTRVPCAAAQQLAPQDKAPPALRTSATSRQAALQRGGVVVHARCAEGCLMWAGGDLRIGRRHYSLRVAPRPVAAGNRARFELRLSKTARPALRRALRRGGRPYATVRVWAVDAAENRSPIARKRVRLVR